MSEKKQIVMTAMTELIGKGNLAAVEPLLRADFVDHNPQVATTSRAAWLDNFRDFPLREMKIDIQQLVAEGDYVTMFSRRWLPGGDVIAVADVFRFAGELVAEHWEVVQPLGDDDPNPLATLGSVPARG
ncbi:nuclear transport factor 2 family protein [Microlunatus sp. GCM10028923]|uniref:nuclear transport factor 2 family protein n=1 Tax=Microlunatus sp. GCM10028923 TaxID=3273400 RepID=UPI00362377AC